MDPKVFAAEGDNSKLTVFAASALALVLTSGIGVLVGTTVSEIVSPRMLAIVAGLGFVAIGLWTLSHAWSGT